MINSSPLLSITLLKFIEETQTLNQNFLRKQMFCQHSQNEEMILPNSKCSLSSFSRALCKSIIWISAHDSQNREPDPCLHDWKESHGNLRWRWMSVPQVASACQGLVKCGYKKLCYIVELAVTSTRTHPALPYINVFAAGCK